MSHSLASPSSRRLRATLPLLLSIAGTSLPYQALAAAPPVPATDAAGMQAELVPAERAWAIGVSDERQQAARLLFQQGNALLKESFFKQAIDKYREALAQWNHPGIHYNMALTLINTDEPLEVRRHLLEAIKFGDAPIDDKKLEHGKNYLKLIEKQLSELTLSCKQPNTTLVLNGKRVLDGPGTYKTVLPPGDHRLTATEPGHERRDYDLSLFPGRRQELTVRVFTEEEMIEKRRRWPVWLPVAVTASGAAIVGGGFYFLYRSNQKLQSYDVATASNVECNDSNGCHPSSRLVALRDTADTYKTISYVAFASGAAALTTGTTMLLMNMTVSRRMTTEERDGIATVQPVFTPNSLGVVGTARF